MDEVKQNMLDELYALRAGLSTISVENDEIEQHGAKADVSLGETLKSSDMVLGGKKNFEQEERNKKGLLLTWTLNSYSRQDYESYYGLDYITKTQKMYQHTVDVSLHDDERKKKKGYIASGLLVILLGLIVVSIFSGNFIIGLASGAILMGFLRFICLGISDMRSARKNSDSEFDRKALADYTKMIADYPAWENRAKDIVAKMENSIKPKISQCDALYEVLRNRYALFLDERDWQYVDLIIFYLETGRADNMKEALQLVEREVQTQRIIDAIEEATQRICFTVQVAAQRISLQLSEISTQLNTVMQLQAIQIAQMSEIVGELKSGNAMLKKVNVSSQQLMKDVKQLKSYCKK